MHLARRSFALHAQLVAIHGQIGTTGTTAQVQPAAFAAGMMRAAEERGAKLQVTVTGLLRRGADVVGVDLDGETLEGDAVVIAMGPWSQGDGYRFRRCSA